MTKNISYSVYNLPQLASNMFKYGTIYGYTGSIISREATDSLGIYKHYGIVYGFDDEDVLWIIENNINGVTCVTLKTFLSNHSNYKIDCLKHPHLSKTIIERVKEKAHLTYDFQTNNCEHFTNYCLTGINESHQITRTELLLNLFITYYEFKLINAGADSYIIKKISDFRNILGVEAIIDLQEYLNKLNHRND